MTADIYPGTSRVFDLTFVGNDHVCVTYQYGALFSLNLKQKNSSNKINNQLSTRVVNHPSVAQVGAVYEPYHFRTYGFIINNFV